MGRVGSAHPPSFGAAPRLAGPAAGGRCPPQPGARLGVGVSANDAGDGPPKQATPRGLDEQEGSQTHLVKSLSAFGWDQIQDFAGC